MKNLQKTLPDTFVTILCEACLAYLILAFALTGVASGAESLKIKLERNGCTRNLCAVYSLEIFSDGQLTFVGHRNTEVIGQQTKQLKKQEMQQLGTAFESAKFFSIDVSPAAVDRNRACLIEFNYECQKVLASRNGVWPRGVIEQCENGAATVPAKIGVSHCDYGDKVYFANNDQAKWIDIDTIKDDSDRVRLQELARLIDRVANSQKWIGDPPARAHAK